MWKSLATTVLALASVAASAQTPSDRKIEQQEFREYAACAGYWRVMTQCLPSIGGLQPNQQEQARKTFEELLATADMQIEWLGERARLPPNTQKQLLDQARENAFSAIGGKCVGALKLIPTYRDKCAALFKSTTARMVKEHAAQKGEASGGPPVRDVEMDCTGTLEASDDTFKKDATAHVRIFGGHVIAIIKPYGMVTGPINKTEPNYIRFSVQTSTFTVEGRKPTVGAVDRVNAGVSIMFMDPRYPNDYIFWFACKVRKPQF